MGQSHYDIRQDGIWKNGKLLPSDKTIKCYKGHECKYIKEALTDGLCDQCKRTFKKGEKGIYKCDICNYIID
tara:strand:+ start:154 stop:369 length:216 start_codon:yes stop_codon:yes gene_type:complete